jgi:hypothetical protein
MIVPELESYYQRGAAIGIFPRDVGMICEQAVHDAIVAFRCGKDKRRVAVFVSLVDIEARAAGQEELQSIIVPFGGGEGQRSRTPRVESIHEIEAARIGTLEEHSEGSFTELVSDCLSQGVGRRLGSVLKQPDDPILIVGLDGVEQRAAPPLVATLDGQEIVGIREGFRQSGKCLHQAGQRAWSFNE